MAAKRRPARGRHQPARLTGLPRVEAVHLNLPLRFRALWSKPHVGLPPSLLTRPWPADVWEAFYATLLRCVTERDARWADAFEGAVSTRLGPLLSRRAPATVSAAEVARALRDLAVPKPGRGRPPGRRWWRWGGIEPAACFVEVLAKVLRRVRVSRPAKLGGPHYDRPPVDVLRAVRTWWAEFDRRTPLMPSEDRLARALRAKDEGGVTPSADCALRLTAALFERSPRDLRRGVAQYRRTLRDAGGLTFYRHRLAEHAKAHLLHLSEPASRPSRPASASRPTSA